MDLRELLNNHQNLHLALDDLNAEDPAVRERWHQDLEANLQELVDGLGGQEELSFLFHVITEAVMLNLDHPRVLARTLAFFDVVPPLLLQRLGYLPPELGAI
jgi:hypothetical protein